MTNEARKFSITYSLGLIPPPKLMSTLTVFYDEVWLPFPYDLDAENKKYPLYAYLKNNVSDDEDARLKYYLHSAQKYYSEWKRKWDILLRASIIKTTYINKITLPKTPIISIARSIWEEQKAEQEAMLLELSNILIPSEVFENITETESDFSDDEMQEMLDADQEMAFRDIEVYALRIHTMCQHALSHPTPELFFSDPSDTRTEHLAGFLVHSLFHYQVPQLGTLNAEQILEVRDYLRDTKEGFAYYIYEMTDDVEQRLKGGNLSEIKAAQKTFERKILPQYEEFRRQLAAKKTGFWSKVLAEGGKFLQVNAAPWTPAFWGAALAMCGVSLGEFTKSEQENFLTNKNQAFHYLAKLESKVSSTTR